MEGVVTGGIGRGVSLTTIGEGWVMKSQDKKKYAMQFSTFDRGRTGYLLGKRRKAVDDEQ